MSFVGTPCFQPQKEAAHQGQWTPYPPTFYCPSFWDQDKRFTCSQLSGSCLFIYFYFLNNVFVTHTFSSQGTRNSVSHAWQAVNFTSFSESVKFQMGELILPTSLPQREGKLASWVVNFLWIMQIGFFGAHPQAVSGPYWLIMIGSQSAYTHR